MNEEPFPHPAEPEAVKAEPMHEELSAPEPPPPDQPPEPPPEASPLAPPRRRRQRTLVPWVYALAFVVLGWAVLFLWRYPAGTQAQPGQVVERVDALNQHVQTLEAAVKELAARPVAQPQALAALQAEVGGLAARKAPDLSGLEGRIAALEQRPASATAPATASEPPAPADLAPIQQKLAQLDQQVAKLSQAPQAGADMSAVQDRVAALGQQVTALSGRLDGITALRDQMGQFGQRMDQLARDQQGLAGNVQSLAAGQKNAESGATSRIAANAAAIEALRGEMNRIDAGLGRAAAGTRAEAALAALQAGQPLGEIPNAPAAVARFATEAPPTVSELRRAFPAVAQKALAASRPDNADQRFVDRVWSRAQNLVTVRQGDRVLVGDPASGVIARAQDDIDAGDVAGAIDALSQLSGPAAQAVAPWLQSAKALVAARAALVGMAGQG